MFRTLRQSALATLALASSTTFGLAVAQKPQPVTDLASMETRPVFAEAELGRLENARPLGTLDAFVVRLEDGLLRGATVETRSASADGAPELRRVEFSKLTWDAEASRFSLAMTRAAFAALPLVGDERPPADRAPTLTSAELRRTALYPESGRESWGTFDRLVLSEDGKALAYGVVAAGAARHPVPWDAVEVTELENSDLLRLSVAKPASKLTEAPTVDRERTLASPQVRREIEAFWKTEPTEK